MYYRFYFNSHLDAPLVCSIDTGDDTEELNIETMTILGSGTMKSVYRKERQPKFWIEVNGKLEIVNGHATITQE